MYGASSAAAGGLSVMPILMIVIVGVVIYMAYKRKKAAKDASPFLSNRKNKDEVWRTIKEFLKQNGQQGKELVDSYVVKRQHIDASDPNSSNLDKKIKMAELKIRKFQLDEINKKAKANGTPIKKPLYRDVFVVVFKTRDSKTGKEDAPRAFECEVVMTRINKKQNDRKIVINKELDYDREMEWIAPIRAAEEIKAKAIEKRLAQQKAAQEKLEKKRLARQEKREKAKAERLAKKEAKANNANDSKK